MRVVLACVVWLCAASVASAAVAGPTAKAAALAATKTFAAHQVVAWNRPGAAYTLGTCRLLHRKPWVAYDCSFELHGVPAYCHGLVTIGVRRAAGGSYLARAVKSRYLDDQGC